MLVKYLKRCFVGLVIGSSVLVQSFAEFSTNKLFKIVQSCLDWGEEFDGNLLAVNWNKNGQMLLVSRVFDNLYETNGKYKTKISDATKAFVEDGGHIATGITWIFYDEQQKIVPVIKVLDWLKKADAEQFDQELNPERIELLTSYLNGLYKYLECMSAVTQDKNVLRPQSLGKYRVGGCVTEEKSRHYGYG